MQPYLQACKPFQCHRRSRYDMKWTLRTNGGVLGCRPPWLDGPLSLLALSVSLLSLSLSHLALSLALSPSPLALSLHPLSTEVQCHDSEAACKH